MGTMTRAQFGKLLEQGLNTVFGLDYKRFPEEWKGVFESHGSKKAFEEDQLVTGFGTAAVKAEGAGVAYDEAQEGWTARYQHETIALAFAITQEAIEDNLYMTMGQKYARALARAMQETKEIKGAAVLNNAYDTNYVGGDGKALLAQDHPLVGGGTLSNAFATATDLSEAALEDMLIKIRKAVDDRGLPIVLKAKGLIIPAELEYVAHRILKSNLRPGTSDNDTNALKDKGLFQSAPKIITRLSSAQKWYVTTDTMDGLKHYKRKGLSRKMDVDFDSGNYRYMTRERYAFGWTDYKGLYGSGN